MAAASPVPLIFPPGVQRDGTLFDSDRAPDSLWCRWRLGRPRKIGGFSQITDTLNGVPRRIHMFYQGPNTIIHVGTSKSLQQVVVDQNGAFVSAADRTPTTFSGGPNVGWTIDALFNAAVGSTNSALIAHAAPDLAANASSGATTPFFGQIDSQLPLIGFSDPGAVDGVYTLPQLSGGIICIPPYVFGFGNNGSIQWSAPNLPLYLGIAGGTSGAGGTRASAQKFLAAASGPQSPSALFWTTSEVFTATFIGGPATWDFARITRSSSLISTDAIVEYDNLYFWAGIDRFFVFNGTVVELPNAANLDYFFDNMNWPYAAKTTAFKIPRFGEIWFCAPLFNNTEPSHAVIYNVRENCWYDTVLPNSGRACGFQAEGLRFPVMGGTKQGPNGYSLWLHENGTDQSVNGVLSAVRSYFETPVLGSTRNQQPTNDGLSVEMFEADMVQTGDIAVTVIGGANQRAPQSTSPAVTIRQVPQVRQDQIPGLRQDKRQLRFHIESNQIGGNYIVGRNLAHMATSEDATVLG